MNATTQTLSSHLQREGGQFTEGIILCIIICKWDGHQFVGHSLIPLDLWDEINIMHNSLEVPFNNRSMKIVINLL